VERFEKLREKILPVLLPYGVERLALFGSVVRREDTPESDIDILVEFEEPRKRPLGFFTWVRLERELSERLGRKVDLVSNRGLNRHIRPHVEAEMVMLYEKTG
jgi:predicted nucleotidyltransferase